MMAGVICLMIVTAKIAYDRGMSKGYSNGMRDARINKRQEMKEKIAKAKEGIYEFDNFYDPQTVRVINRRNNPEGYHACSNR